MTQLTLEDFLIWEFVINTVFLLVGLPIAGYFMEKWAVWRFGLFRKKKPVETTKKQ